MTPAQFRALFPEFALMTDAQIQPFIDAYSPLVQQGIWGIYCTPGLGNLVAHYIKWSAILAAGTPSVPNAGDVTEKRVGSVSVGRGANLLEEQMDDPFMRTQYGQEYKRLVRLVGTKAVVTRGCPPPFSGVL